MKNFLTHLRNRIIAGIIFLIPILAVMKSVKNLWDKMSKGGSYIVELLGLKAIFGTAAVPIANTLILLLLFYAFGYLVKISFLTRFRDWLENSVLKYVPGYLTVKAQIMQKVNPAKDTRQPVIVNTSVGNRYGLLVEEKEGFATVFFPNCPDTNNGQVWLEPVEKITKLSMEPQPFLKSIQQFGKGLNV